MLRTGLLLGVLLLALAFGAVWFLRPNQEEPEPATQTAATGPSEGTKATNDSSVAPSDAASASKVSSKAEDPPGNDGSGPEAEGAESDAPEATEADSPTFDPPSFDIVTVTPRGEAVIAGRAEPGSRVEIRAGETLVGEVEADARGEWILLPELPLESGRKELSLRAVLPAGETVESEEIVLVAVPERERAVAAGPVARDAVLPAESAGEAGEDRPLVVEFPRSGAGAARLLQSPEDRSLASGDLALESVTYDEKGQVIVSGRTQPSGRVVLYLDDRAIGETTSGETGEWSLRPESNVSGGLHRLRVDALDSGGAVVARVETPFQREDAARVHDREDSIVIQPGNNLWRIARRTYGEGIRYTVIYEANADQIRDPDLIYPGQVFTLPSAEDE